MPDLTRAALNAAAYENIRAHVLGAFDEEDAAWMREDAKHAVDAVLPLIADAIGGRVARAERHRSFGPMSAKDYWLGFTEGTSEARDLVRSLMGDEQ